ncbi:MAG: hypothetical protein NT129_01740, partial [Candidatus Aenigmarchaeota archaeon]|nr:hypothetical protein [Candidatus Aenigmarchaeota archaeon]
NQMGFFGFLLPWLLMFAVTYGLLLKSKALGEDHKIIGVVSLVTAFFVIGFGGIALGNFFQNIFGIASMLIAGILVIVLFVSMAGGNITKFMEGKSIIALIIVIGIIVFAVALGSIGVSVSSDVVATIFIVIIMGIAVFFIASGK